MLTQRKRETRWAMYDWANSVYSLTIATAIFPPFYNSISKAAAIKQGSPEAGPYLLTVAGITLENSVFYSFAISLASLVIAFLSPLLSGIADSRGLKKRMMQLFCYLGAISCSLLFFSTKELVGHTLLLFVLATIGFSGSLVFYNAFLPEVTTPDRLDRVSAKGFSLGYIGSVLLLLVNLAFILLVDKIFPVQAYANQLLAGGGVNTMVQALEDAKDHFTLLATQLAFLTVGIWWAGFAQITFRALPEEKPTEAKSSWLTAGYSKLANVFQSLKQNPKLRLFLIAFFFISMGVQTVLALATLFGSKELHLETSQLIMVVLVIQLVAILGATVFARLSERYGNFSVLVSIVVMWISITLLAYTVQNFTQFVGLAIYVGIVMGAIQSLFRSTYAKLIPENQTEHASYFSFYDVTEKVAIVLGTATFGLVEAFSGSMRNSSLALGIYFAIGLVPLLMAKSVKNLPQTSNSIG